MFTSIPFPGQCVCGHPQLSQWEKVSCVALSDCLGISELSPDVHLAGATNSFCKCVSSWLPSMPVFPVLLGTAYQESERSI